MPVPRAVSSTCQSMVPGQGGRIMERNAITLLQYAGFLLVVGLASAFYSAADRTVGWNPHGVSGLIACGGAAALIAVLGILTGKGKSAAAWVGLALAFLLLSYGGMKTFQTLRSLAEEGVKLAASRGITQEAAERSLLYKSWIFGAMALFSLNAFMRLGMSLRSDKTA